VIGELEGVVVGLRGDGALASFGLVDTSSGRPPVSSKKAEHAVREACRCGDAIVKTVQKAVNPVLAKAKIALGKEILGVGKGRLQVGVGIDVGDIVATRIGLGRANELTAYGVPVNHCCKRSFGNDMVILTRQAKNMFPKSKRGRTKFSPYPEVQDAFILRYPDDVHTVE
jgi:hypothetical protein